MYDTTEQVGGASGQGVSSSSGQGAPPSDLQGQTYSHLSQPGKEVDSRHYQPLDRSSKSKRKPPKLVPALQGEYGKLNTEDTEVCDSR